MSTEHQQYSIANQSATIQQYADAHNMSIVKTYGDAARSGVTIQRREGLRSLLADVESGQAEYSAVLVYDVSRWGRFQDVDESAFYEYRCKQAKITVHYCAEQFPNDGSVSTALLKAIKRAMAGEYSRELSVKTATGKRRIIQAGFRCGGTAGYGLRRFLIDRDGRPKGVLNRGEAKSIATDRVIQVLGPPEEVELVRRIYQWYIEDPSASPRSIAERLNASGIISEFGRGWTRQMVQTILDNPKYTGANVAFRRKYRLGGGSTTNPREEWFIRPNVFEPLIDEETFNQVQRIRAERKRHVTDEELLARLKRAWNRAGKLSVRIIEDDSEAASGSTYLKRFGSLKETYRRIGYVPKREFPSTAVSRRVHALRRRIAQTIAADLTRDGVDVQHDLRSGLLTVSQELTIRVAVSPWITNSLGYRWELRLGSVLEADITIIARLTGQNDAIQDYFIIPRTQGWRGEITVSAEVDLVMGIYRFDDLSVLKQLVRRSKVIEAL